MVKKHYRFNIRIYLASSAATKLLKMKLGLLAILLILPLNSIALDPDSMLPPINDIFRARVNFWKNVYTEIDSDEAFIHDKNNLSIVYQKVDLKTKSYRKRARNGKKAVRKIKKILRSIAKKNLKNLNTEEQKILEISKSKTRSEVYKAIKSIRAQHGGDKLTL